MLAALTTYGIQPGPLLLQRESDLVWGLIASLFIGNTLLLILNLPLAPVWAKLLRIPRPYLYAGILFFASMGAYAVNGSSFDLILLLIFGLIGFGMRRFGLPVLPLIVAVILGPRVEAQGRRALQLSSGDAKGLIGGVDIGTGQFQFSALAIVVYVIILVILLWPLIFRLLRTVLPPRAAEVVDQVTVEAEPPTHDPQAANRTGDSVTIVVGYTPTPGGRAALMAAVHIAEERKRPLVVVNSSRGDALADPGFAQPADLDWASTTLEEAGIEFSIRQFVRGREASEEVLDVVEEVDAELCVIGIRRRTAVSKMILGSNAHRILMDAPCPVLAVKAVGSRSAGGTAAP